MGRYWGVAAVAATLLVLTTTPVNGVARQSVARAGDAPPMPFEDRGACPFEGCVYREWTTRAPVVVHRDRQVGAPRIFRLQVRETVAAITGVVVTLKAGRVQFREPRDLSTASGRLHIEPGQTLFLLTYQGEGFTKAWFNGQYYTDVDTVDFLNLVCEIEPGRCAGTIVQKSRTEWWVQVRNKAGAVGWTNEPDKFDGKDALRGGLRPMEDSQLNSASRPRRTARDARGKGAAPGESASDRSTSAGTSDDWAVGPTALRTIRSTTFCSSRTLPGQRYVISALSAAADRVRACPPCRRRAEQRK